jgi:hypothetical protein
MTELQEYFWVLECFESDVECFESEIAIKKFYKKMDEMENGMVETEGMVEEPKMFRELPSTGVVASSGDYIFENYEDAKICADSLMTKESKTSRKREKGERNHRWVVESHWVKEVPVKWCTGKNLSVL